MGRSQANLKLDVFEGLRGLSKDAKLLYFALLVEPTVNQAGIGALRERLWAKDVELTAAETEKALRELDGKRYVLVDYDTEEVLVRTLIRNDGVAEKPNLLRAACRAAVLLGSPRLRVVLAEELRKLPPKPEPTVGKNGQLYEHPDPHATAALIDPSGGPDDPAREPIANGSATVPEPTGLNGSRTVREPFNGEPFANLSRTYGGGGGGGGGGNPPPVEQNSPSKNTHCASRAASATDSDGFDEFWSAYPRKTAKRAAEKAYAAAVKRGIEPGYMISAVRRYAAVVANSDPRFTAHAATWLNQGRYDDEHPAPSTALATGTGGPPQQGTASKRAQAFLDLRKGTSA
jgi:hypothetical protein